MSMATESLKEFIREVPDFPKPGVSFKDITTLLNNPDAFRACIDALAERYAPQNITKVVGVESRGFIFAAPLAYKLKVGLVPVRKKGKLPAQCIQQQYELEYGTDIVEMHRDAIQPGDRVLVLDDVITAGTAAREAHQIITSAGAEVAGLTISLDRSEIGNDTNLSAVQDLERQLGIRVVSIVQLDDLIDLLEDSDEFGDYLQPVMAYRSKYGVQPAGLQRAPQGQPG